MKRLLRIGIKMLPPLILKLISETLIGLDQMIGKFGRWLPWSLYSLPENSDRPRAKIAFFTLVLNGSPWLKLNIENIYPYASQIFIIEGATKADGEKHYFDGKAEGYYTSDGHSIDETLEEIEHLKGIDKEGKIIVMTKKGAWNGKTEMCNSFMHLVQADYLWQLDVDEFYKQEDIQKIVAYLSEHPEVTCVQFYAKYFIGSFDTISIGEFGNAHFEWNRIFKVNKYCRWLRHEPPKLVDRRVGKPMDEIRLLDRKKTMAMGIYMYHYSYVTSKDILFKEQFFGTSDLVDYLARVKKEIDRSAYPIKLTYEKFAERGDVYLVKFEGEHPEPIQKNLTRLRTLELHS